MAEKVLVCRYAGDEEDEFCATCDGIKIILEDGEEVEATQCGGYSVEEAVVEEGEPVTVEQVEEVNPVEANSDHAEPRDSNETLPSGTITPPTSTQGATVEIQAESGVSVELKNAAGVSTWYKLGYTEKVMVKEVDDLEQERKNLWDRVNTEVDNQLAEVIALTKKQ